MGSSVDVLLVRAGRCRSGTGGRSSVIDCGIRLIFEGSSSRPGVRRGSPSKSGHGRTSRLPIVLSRASRDGGGPSCVLVLAPTASRARSSVRQSVKGGGLPEEGGEFAGDRDRVHAGGLAPLISEVLHARANSRGSATSPTQREGTRQLVPGAPEVTLHSV
jgi:hypothetical protein